MGAIQQEVLRTEAWRLPVHLFRLRNYNGDGAHWHVQPEMIFVEEGTQEFGVGHTVVTAKAGDLILINPNEAHFGRRSGATLICLQLKGEFLDQFGGVHLRFAPLVVQNEQIAGCFQAMTSRMNADTVDDGFALVSALCQLLSVLTLSGAARVLSPQESARFRDVDQPFKRVMTEISEHFASPMTTHAMAELAYMTETYFCRYFKQRAGETPMRCLHRFRITHAMALLEKTNRSVTEIGLAVGFPDGNYFARVFRSFTGQSPTAYRKSFREQGETEPLHAPRPFFS